MSHQPDDRLEKELERLEQDYRALPDDEPAAMIDQAILNRARREVESPPGRRPWSFGWVHGLTSAAVVVLGVALFLQAPETPEPGPMRVAKPPSSKLRDIESEIKPLRIPARQQAAPGAPPTLVREVPPAASSGVQELRVENEKLAISAEELESLGKQDAATVDALESSVLEESRREVISDVAQKTGLEAPATDPDTWIQQLLELKRTGQDEALARELEAFKTAWPDYPLPPELVE